jgi:hypothetical protein
LRAATIADTSAEDRTSAMGRNMGTPQNISDKKTRHLFPSELLCFLKERNVGD